MITMKGQFNSANIMIDVLDDATRSQIQDFLNNPSFRGSYIAIMPDCHKGEGSCIGFTMKMNERIIPNIVGVDIGCGMLSANFRIGEGYTNESFDKFIKEKIPSGFSSHNGCVVDSKEVEKFQDVTSKMVSSGMKINEGHIINSIGTLGGGNHFIEVGMDSSHTDIWVTIHSGSRNFGKNVAEYHTKKAKEFCEKVGAETRGMPFLLVDSREGESYLEDMRIAQDYASLNRVVMLNIISQYFKKGPSEVIESVHNFIDDTGMIRKGATPAQKDQKVIIPFNMRDGLAICVGKGNEKYNFSAPHGAGRILSRSKAKETLDVELFQEDMRLANVYTTTANAQTLDEAPDAYKDKQIILDNIKETVDIVDFVKPIYNYKSCEK